MAGQWPISERSLIFSSDLPVQRMRLAGATVTSSESALFELMRDASHPNFKAISGLIKEEKDRTKAALEALVFPT